MTEMPENLEQYQELRCKFLLEGALGYIGSLLRDKPESIAALTEKLDRDIDAISGALAQSLREDLKVAGFVTGLFSDLLPETE